MIRPIKYYTIFRYQCWGIMRVYTALLSISLISNPSYFPSISKELLCTRHNYFICLIRWIGIALLWPCETPLLPEGAAGLQQTWQTEYQPFPSASPNTGQTTAPLSQGRRLRNEGSAWLHGWEPGGISQVTSLQHRLNRSSLLPSDDGSGGRFAASAESCRSLWNWLIFAGQIKIVIKIAFRVQAAPAGSPLSFRAMVTVIWPSSAAFCAMLSAFKYER